MSECAAVFDGTDFTCFTGTKVQILTELLQPGSVLRRERGRGVTKVGGGRGEGEGREGRAEKSGWRRWKLKRRGFGAKVSASLRRKSKGLRVN
jgi:hypothetical protein